MRSSSAPAGDKGVIVWHLRYLFRFGWVLGCVSNGILGGFTSHAGTIFVVERVNRNASAGVDAPTCAWRIIICPSADIVVRSEEHTSELQSLMRISYAVFCLQKKTSHIYKRK